jgi:hypothetical protein
LITLANSRIAWIQQFTSGKIWFSKLTSEETKRNYSRGLQGYCQEVNKNPDELLKLKPTFVEIVFMMQKSNGTEIINENAADDLLENFFAESKLTASAKFGYKTAIFSFYKHNRRDLKSGTASNIVAPEYKQRCPEMNDIIALENAMTTARDKFLVWFLASTAFRVGTLGKLLWKDLQPTEDKEIPYQLVIDSVRLKGSGVGRYRGLKQVAFLHLLAG